MIPEEVLAKMSPHRTHESNWLKTLLCRFGLHRCYYSDLDAFEARTTYRLLPWLLVLRCRVRIR